MKNAQFNSDFNKLYLIEGKLKNGCWYLKVQFEL